MQRVKHGGYNIFRQLSRRMLRLMVSNECENVHVSLAALKLGASTMV